MEVIIMFSISEFIQSIEQKLEDLNPEEKKQLYACMLELCIKNMSETEIETIKSKFMNTKQGKMKGSTMMDMMASMMGRMEPNRMRGFRPMMDMCADMMSQYNTASDKEQYPTDELADLFRDWCTHVEDEIVSFVKSSGEIDERKIAEHFKLSAESVQHLIKNLQNEGRF